MGFVGSLNVIAFEKSNRFLELRNRPSGLANTKINITIGEIVDHVKSIHYC